MEESIDPGGDEESFMSPDITNDATVLCGAITK